MIGMADNYDNVKKYVLEQLERELPKNLHYHGAGHTVDVIDAADRLFKAQMKIEGREAGQEINRVLLLTGALFHDTGFLRKYKDNEEIGAEIARQTLQRFGYSPFLGDFVADLILATKLPQNPNNGLARVLCDADLDNLGREDFYVKGELLRRELAEQGVVLSPRQWYENSLRFLQGHKYFTRAARDLRGKRKRQHIKEIKELLGMKDE